MNIVRIDSFIFRGPSPKSYDDWQELKRLGIKAVLDLETGSKLFDDGDLFLAADRAYICDIVNYPLPMGEILPPRDWQLDTALDLMTDCKGSAQKILVHCKAGVDRTGMVCAAYRIRENNWTKAAAITEMKQSGMHWWYCWWAWFL